ncbi:MAG: transposase [Rickettsiaceae bacterium]|nr:transposase [Rickettsiaceae bacterium]
MNHPNCDKNVFESYVEQILIKELQPGQIIVMDNINFHKEPQVMQAITHKAYCVMFLPSY